MNESHLLQQSDMHPNPDQANIAVKLSLWFQISTAFQRLTSWIQNYLFLYNLLLHHMIINLYFLSWWQTFDLFMLNILSRTILTWGVKPGHPGDPQNNLPTSIPWKHASTWLLQGITLTLKVFCWLTILPN